jgi:predicted O-methyltransferase YrrM
MGKMAVDLLHNKYFNEIKIYADTYSIPIMASDSVKLIKDYIKKNNIKSILEVGTDIGYLSINMALVDEKINVISVESNEKKYLDAIKNAKKFFLESRITLMYNPNLNVKLNQKFDLIIMDFMQDSYIDLFNRYQKYLKDDGYIITNNVSLKGYNNSDKGLINKIKGYIEFLEGNEVYNTEFMEIDDGLAISKKRM